MTWNWLVHINEIVNIACKKLGLLKKLTFTFDRDKLLKIYKTSFRICLCRLGWLFFCINWKVRKRAAILFKNCHGTSKFGIHGIIVFWNGFVSFARRREIFKRTIIYYNFVPQYLCNILTFIGIILFANVLIIKTSFFYSRCYKQIKVTTVGFQESDSNPSISGKHF